MKAARYDFVFEKNTDWIFNIGYNTGTAASFSPADVTGYMAEFKIFENRYPLTEALLTYDNNGEITVSGTEGKFRFVINKNVNNSFTAAEYYYTFEITDPTGITERILKGSIKLEN